MKNVVSVVGALVLFLAIWLLVIGLAFSKTQTDQMVYGIYSIATGVIALVMLEASKDTTQV